MTNTPAFDLDAHYRRLQTATSRYRLSKLAEIADANHRDPIYLLSTNQRAPRLLILAGIHGDEPAGLLAVQQLCRRLCAAAAQPAVAISIISPINPSGLRAGRRTNAERRDINRDFVHFATAEARAVRDGWQHCRPDLVLSLHEGPQRGVFAFGNRCVAPALGRFLSDQLQQRGILLARRDYFGRRLKPAGFAAHSRLANLIVTLGRHALQRAASNRFADEQGVGELTVETPKGADLALRVAAQLAAIDVASDYLATRSDPPPR